MFTLRDFEPKCFQSSGYSDIYKKRPKVFYAVSLKMRLVALGAGQKRRPKVYCEMSRVNFAVFCATMFEVLAADRHTGGERMFANAAKHAFVISRNLPPPAAQHSVEELKTGNEFRCARRHMQFVIETKYSYYIHIFSKSE